MLDSTDTQDHRTQTDPTHGKDLSILHGGVDSDSWSYTAIQQCVQTNI